MEESDIRMIQACERKVTAIDRLQPNPPPPTRPHLRISPQEIAGL